MPTVGLTVETLEHKHYRITFWDVGGQATRLWKHYFDSVDGIIYVLDSTDEKRILKNRDELSKLVKDPGLSHVPILLMYNK